jgi:hypothetical protein
MIQAQVNIKSCENNLILVYDDQYIKHYLQMKLKLNLNGFIINGESYEKHA